MRAMDSSFTLGRMATPLGELLLVSDAQGRLRALDFVDYRERMERLLAQHYRGADVRLSDGPSPVATRRALEAYFEGELTALSPIVCETGGTPFQRAVWAALRTIPAGQTASYGAQAALLGRPKAVRAVGHANGQNPIAIVVPCHRVIGASGSLTGYAGGLARKQWLLAHERSQRADAHEQSKGTASKGSRRAAASIDV
jgi:methylated-DNA-[protein]-cysteine S-methyltransferase